MPTTLLLLLMALSLAGGGTGAGLNVTGQDAAITSFLRERGTWQPMCLYTFADPDIGSSSNIIANRVPGGACPFEALQPDNDLVSSLNSAASFWQLGVHLAEDPNNATTRVQLSSISSVSAREFFTMAAVRNDSVSGSGVTFEMVIRRRAKTNRGMTLFSIANEYDDCVDSGFRLDLNEHQVLAFIYFVPVLEEGGEAGVEACYEQRLFSVDTSAACQLPPLVEPVERTPAVQIAVTLDPSSERGHWETSFYMSYTDADTMERVDCAVHDEQHPPNSQVLNKLIEGRYQLYLGNSRRNVSSARKRKRLAAVREFQLVGNSTSLNATERLRAMLKQKLTSISGPRLPKAMRIFGDNSLSLHILGTTFSPLNEDTPLAYLRSKLADFKEQYGDQIVDYLVNLVQKKASKSVVGQRNGDILTSTGQSIDEGSTFSRSALYQGAGGATFDLFHFAIYRRVVTEEQGNSITRQLLLPSRQFPSNQQTVRIPEDSTVLLNLTMLHGVFDDLRLELRGLPEFGHLLLFPNQTLVTAENMNAFRELPLEYQHRIFFRPEPDQNNGNLPLPNPVAFSRRLQPYATVRFGIADSLAGRVVNRSLDGRIDIFVDAVNDAPRTRNDELEVSVRVGIPVILNLEGDDIDGTPTASSSDEEISDASGLLSSFAFTNATNTSMGHQLLKIVRMPKFGKLFDCNTTCETMKFAGDDGIESTRVYRNSVDIDAATHSTTLAYIYHGWGQGDLGKNATGLVVDELWYRLSDGDPGIFSDVGVVKFVLASETSASDDNVLATIRMNEDSIRLLDLGKLDPLAPFFNSRTRFELTVLPRHGNIFQFNDVNESDTAATPENATGSVPLESIGARIKPTGTIVSDPLGRIIYVPKLDYSSIDPRVSFARDDDGEFFEYKVLNTPANNDSLVVQGKSPAALFSNGSVARRVKLVAVNVPDGLIVLPPFAFSANSPSLDTVPAPVTFKDVDSINSDQLYQVNLEATDGISELTLGVVVTDEDVMVGCPYERPCVLIWSTNGTRLNTSSNSTRDSELSFRITTQLYDPSHIELTGTMAVLSKELAALAFRDLSGISSNVEHTSGFKLWVKRIGAGDEGATPTIAIFTIKFPGDATSVSSSSENMVPALNSQLERYVSTLLFLLAAWLVLSIGSCVSFEFCCCCCSRARKKRRRKFEQEQRRFRDQVAQNDYEYSVLLMSLADLILQPDLLVSLCLLKSCVRSTDRVKETEVLMQAFILRSQLPLLESERQGTRFVFKLMATEYSEGIASSKGSGSIFQRRKFLVRHSAASMALACFCQLAGSKWMSELLSRGDARKSCSVDPVSELEAQLDKLTQHIAALPVEIVILCRACAKLCSGEDDNQNREMELDAVHLVFFNHFIGPALLFPRECVPGLHPSFEQEKAMRMMAVRIAEFADEWRTCGNMDDTRSRSYSTDSLLGTFSAEVEAIAACQRKYKEVLETISWSSIVASSYDPSEPKSDVDCELMGMCLMNIHSLLDSYFPEFQRTLLRVQTLSNSEQTEATIARITRLLKALSYPLASIDELVEYLRPELMKDPLLWNDFSSQGWHNYHESERHLQHRHQIQSISDENPQSLLAEHFDDDSDFILAEEDTSPREVDWLNT